MAPQIPRDSDSISTADPDDPSVQSDPAERDNDATDLGQLDRDAGVDPDRASEPADVQGEGDYDAARRYNQAVERFTESGRVEQAARDAEPDSANERDGMQRAEDIGRSRSRDQAEHADSTGPDKTD